MEEAYLGVDIGSISTKGVIIDKNYKILASEYIWTEGDPMGAARKLIELLEKQFDKEKYQIVATGTTGSARKLVGAMLGATMVKNEINYMKEHHVKYILYEELSTPNVARAIADATGAQMLMFSTCHNVTKDEFESGVTFIDLMQQNAEMLKKALE